MGKITKQETKDICKAIYNIGLVAQYNLKKVPGKDPVTERRPVSR